ncbi:uncharacterized protein LOC114576302 [Exaiptasia diaphana]|uniref:BZIP domain-containing protein n=1 Tax=Exaiptasia diaphana TaxID=2652724 RepID=A0A913YSL2_EXADI|nr:uncharacterized protein LOC114576302 [Exaiptasia diaphana]
MDMSEQGLPFSHFLRQREQEFLQDTGCVPRKYNPKPMEQPSTYNIPTNPGSNKVYKTDYNRRARNVISSRKYRKKRKLQYAELERDNKLLQNSINEAEKIHAELNQAFRMLIQHAELCSHCCNVTLCFE